LFTQESDGTRSPACFPIRDAIKKSYTIGTRCFHRGGESVVKGYLDLLLGDHPEAQKALSTLGTFDEFSAFAPA